MTGNSTARLEGIIRPPCQRAARGPPAELSSVPQAAPGAIQVLDDGDDLRHDAQFLLLLPPRECLHTLLFCPDLLGPLEKQPQDLGDQAPGECWFPYPTWRVTLVRPPPLPVSGFFLSSTGATVLTYSF